MSDSYKKGKLLRILREMDKVGNKYDINGIDLTNAIFFSREPQEMFVPIATGSYNTSIEGGNAYLNITDEVLLAKIEKIQMIEEFASISSEYEVEFNVDVNILNSGVNKAIKDIKNLFEYVKSNMMVADATDLEVILPQLDEGEVWVRTIDGWRGMNVGDIEKNVSDFYANFEELTQKNIEDIHQVKTTAEANIEASVLLGKIDINYKQQEFYTYTDSINRRLSLIDNAYRYYSGNKIEDRDNQLLINEMNGGRIGDRAVGTTPARVISGGKIEDRIIPAGSAVVDLDLGGTI